MIALITYEIIQWYKRFVKMTFIFLAIFCFIVSAFTLIRPEIFFQVLAFIILIYSFIIFYNRNKYKKTVPLIRDIKLKIYKILIGEIIFSFIVALLYLLFLIPLYILIYFFWGVLLKEIFEIVIIISLIFFTTSNIIKVSIKIDPENQLLFCVYSLFIFYVLTLFVPYIKIINPFYELWEILLTGNNNFFIHLILVSIFNFLILYLEYFGLRKLKYIYE